MVYIVLYNGLDGWDIESSYDNQKEAKERVGFLRSLKLRLSPYIQEIELGETYLTLDIVEELHEKNIRRTIKSLKEDVSW